MSLASCDIPSQLVLNGQEQLRCSADCGYITMSGKTMAADYITINSKGSFTVNLDSIKMLWNGNKVPKQNIRFYLNNRQLGNSKKAINLNNDSLFSITVSYICPLKYSGGNITLFPSNFILCNDNAVIKDTIFIMKKQ